MTGRAMWLDFLFLYPLPPSGYSPLAGGELNMSRLRGYLVSSLTGGEFNMSGFRGYSIIPLAGGEFNISSPLNKPRLKPQQQLLTFYFPTFHLKQLPSFIRRGGRRPGWYFFSRIPNKLMMSLRDAVLVDSSAAPRNDRPCDVVKF